MTSTKPLDYLDKTMVLDGISQLANKQDVNGVYFNVILCKSEYILN